MAPVLSLRTRLLTSRLPSPNSHYTKGRPDASSQRRFRALFGMPDSARSGVTKQIITIIFPAAPNPDTPWLTSDVVLTVVLIFLLAVHEVAKVGGARARLLARYLVVPIVPLLVTFVILAISRIREMI